MKFCGMCIEDIIAPGAKTYVIDGCVVCAKCATEMLPMRERDERRGYTGGDGGVGRTFEERLAAKHDEIVPAAVVALDTKLEIGPPSEPTSDGRVRRR